MRATSIEALGIGIGANVVEALEARDMSARLDLEWPSFGVHGHLLPDSVAYSGIEVSMVIGIGIDIVFVDDLREQIEGVQNFLQEVFTEEEIATCSGRADPYQCFAARFAAKEAFMKAIGTGWTDDIDFHSISVISDGASVPVLSLNARAQRALKGRGTFSILLSLSHVPQYACAVVVLDQ